MNYEMSHQRQFVIRHYFHPPTLDGNILLAIIITPMTCCENVSGNHDEVRISRSYNRSYEWKKGFLRILSTFRIERPRLSSLW